MEGEEKGKKREERRWRKGKKGRRKREEGREEAKKGKRKGNIWVIKCCLLFVILHSAFVTI